MLALDFALFIRNSSTKLGLSLSAIAVGNALAFRIGSHKFSWVSQETLASELGITERNIRNHCNSLEKAGLLIVKKSPKDKRKNIYSFNSCIIGYHAMNDSQKEKCHKSLVDNFLLTGQNQPDFLEDTSQNQPVKSGQNQPIYNKKTSKKNNNNQQPTELSTAPKEPYERNIKSKEPSATRKKRGLISDISFYPNQENSTLCDQVAARCGMTGMKLLQKFIDVQIKYGTRSDDFNKNFKEFLLREMPPKPKTKEKTKELRKTRNTRNNERNERNAGDARNVTEYFTVN